MQQRIILGGGCFWCIEAAVKRLRGVESVISGYAGGSKPNPSYDEICGGSTGHAEVIEVVFDDEILKLDDLLTVFFAMHDPTTLNRQGHDIGTQYRSIVLTTSDEQTVVVKQRIADLTTEEVYPAPIITKVKALDTFYPAEKYHQEYYDRNPSQGYCQVVINPKIAKLKQKFAQLLKDEST